MPNRVPGAGPSQLLARQLVAALLLVGATAASFTPGLSQLGQRPGGQPAGSRGRRRAADARDCSAGSRSRRRPRRRRGRRAGRHGGRRRGPRRRHRPQHGARSSTGSTRPRAGTTTPCGRSPSATSATAAATRRSTSSTRTVRSPTVRSCPRPASSGPAGSWRCPATPTAASSSRCPARPPRSRSRVQQQIHDYAKTGDQQPRAAAAGGQRDRGDRDTAHLSLPRQRPHGRAPTAAGEEHGGPHPPRPRRTGGAAADQGRTRHRGRRRLRAARGAHRRAAARRRPARRPRPAAPPGPVAVGARRGRRAPRAWSRRSRPGRRGRPGRAAGRRRPRRRPAPRPVAARPRGARSPPSPARCRPSTRPGSAATATCTSNWPSPRASRPRRGSSARTRRSGCWPAPTPSGTRRSTPPPRTPAWSASAPWTTRGCCSTWRRCPASSR